MRKNGRTASRHGKNTRNMCDCVAAYRSPHNIWSLPFCDHRYLSCKKPCTSACFVLLSLDNHSVILHFTTKLLTEISPFFLANIPLNIPITNSRLSIAEVTGACIEDS
ncbi:unnamed protein product [Albugo candida]|uniref:Uncharacterized protein n=1 Tax=Albugo candida TaxID=65357 RepID=A0A024GJR9_9STRA|nr:unnamed protein product [Albugo candida]|eukprot:CCI46574.1 unnamed protein product [Albugo candida]